jgi:hypothetical protein
MLTGILRSEKDQEASNSIIRSRVTYVKQDMQHAQKLRNVAGIIFCS